jgi:hypothetical protein
MWKRTGEDNTLRCSFCHKSQDVVKKLISSPSDYPRAYICDECIAVCHSILEDDAPPGSYPQRHPLTPELFEAMRQWLAVPLEGEENVRRLTQVRKLAESVLGGGELRAALEIPGGADLDAMIASKMGDKAPYSTDLGAAWKIVERLTTACGSFLLRYEIHGDHRELSRERVCDLDPFDPGGDRDVWSAHFHCGEPKFEKFCATAETAPLAICRAALKAYF